MSHTPSLPSRFRVHGELGCGGMGVVYRAHDSVLRQVVAIKVLPSHQDSDAAVRRFRREASGLAALSHPNIVAFHEIGEHEGVSYLVMEFVEGDTLRSWMRRRPPLDQVVACFHGICVGLSHAHARGIVHRDLKPENVLIAVDGVPKIMDFGLARRLSGESKLTRTGTILGTAAYMAPEQTMSSEVGPAADLYALGICLYEALVGELPFRADSEVAMLYRHMTDLPPSPSSLRPDLPAPLNALVLRLLEKNPAQRPRSAAEVAEALAGAAAFPTPPVTAQEERLKLIGRSDDLQRLMQRLAACFDGQGVACLLSAPAGLGRSRLLQELSTHLEARGLRVLRVGPAEQPLQHLQDILGSLDTQPAGIAGALGRRLEENGSPAVLLVDDLERLDSFQPHQVVELLRELADFTPRSMPVLLAGR
ncbi:MAG: serine/threonine-protein kinase PknK, partial [Armatimonadetes bacterium]|nr:serine/threonine-protein kinase PknK [Armatimonadota bacterium]